MNLLFFQEDFEKLKLRREEFRKLHREAGKACGEACSQGAETFHDNAPYEMALKDQALYGGMLSDMDDMLRRAKVIQPEGPDGTVKIGRLVHVKDIIPDESYWVKLGSFWNDSPGKGTRDEPIHASYQSPIARALMGKGINDVVDYLIGRLKKKLKILEIC